jgi:hypothetical protein
MSTTYTYRPSVEAPEDSLDLDAYTIDAVRTPQGWLPVYDRNVEALVRSADSVILGDDAGRALGLVVPFSWLERIEPEPWTDEDRRQAEADARYVEMRDEPWR